MLIEGFLVIIASFINQIWSHWKILFLFDLLLSKADIELWSKTDLLLSSIFSFYDLYSVAPPLLSIYFSIVLSFYIDF